MKSLQNFATEMHMIAVEEEVAAHESLIAQLEQAHQARLARINTSFGFAAPPVATAPSQPPINE